MANFLATNGNDESFRYDVKFYIEDSNSRWVDFSDWSQNTGVKKLLGIGSVSNTIENRFGNFTSTIQEVTLRNADGFFNRPFPPDLLTVSLATAVFPISSGGKLSVIKGRRCKITAQIKVQNVTHFNTASGFGPIDAIQEESLGVFFIDEVTPDLTNKTIKLKLLSLDGQLAGKDCSKIRDGYGWFKNRSVSFLVEEILKSEYGSIGGRWNIDRSPFIATQDGSLVGSLLGRPPLWDGSTWRNDGMYTRALCYANVNSTGSKLYLGCDNELWSYDSTTGTYALIDDATIPAGYLIKWMEYSAIDSKMYIATWEDERWGAKATGQGRAGWNCKVFEFDGTTLTAHRAVGAFCSYQYQMRPSDRTTVGPGDILYRVYNVTPNGEHLACPIEQEIQYLNNLSATTVTYLLYADDGSQSIDSGLSTVVESFSANNERYISAARGMVSYATITLSGDPDPYGNPAIWYVGQKPCIFIGDKAISGVRYLYYFRMKLSGSSMNYFSEIQTITWAANQPWVSLVMQPLTSDAAKTEHVVDVPAGLKWAVPLCWLHHWREQAYDGVSPNAYVAKVFFLRHDNSTAPENEVLVVEVDLTVTAGMFGTVYNINSGETGDNVYWTPIDALWTETWSGSLGSIYYIMILWNRKTGQYAVIGHPNITWSTTTKIWTDRTATFYTSTSPITSLTIDPVSQDVYFFVVGESKVVKINKNAGVVSSDVTPMNDIPISNSEFGLLSNMAVNPDHAVGVPDIYGVTSPTVQLESNSSYRYGLYSLWRISPYITDIVEVADFSDLTKMDAVNYLAQSRDYLAMFDREGDFHMLPRVYSAASADYTISSRIKTMTMNYGEDRIYNIIKISPYETTFNPPDSDPLTLITRTEKNKQGIDPNGLPFVDYSVEQRDTATKRVYAYCVGGGSTTNGASRWKYSVLEFEIEAILSQDETLAATTIHLLSVFGGDSVDEGIHIGDYASTINPDTGATIIRGISSVSATANTVGLSASFGIALKRKAIVKVFRAFKKDSTPLSTKWSDDGVTYLSAGASAAAVTVSFNSAKDVSVGTVFKIFPLPWEYRITGISGTTVTFERAESVTTGGLREAVSANARVDAFWSPKATAGYEIGGMNVFVKWMAGSGTVDRDYTNTFFIGDRLVINCPGTVLEQSKEGVQVAVDGNSVALYDKREIEVDNRFMTRALSNEMVKRWITSQPNPKFHATLTVEGLVYVDLVTNRHSTVIDVVDSEAFPVSLNFSERFYVIGVANNPKTFETTLNLVGFNDI